MIGRLNHVAIAVGDIAKAAKLYRDTLGADVSGLVPQPDHGVNTDEEGRAGPRRTRQGAGPTRVQGGLRVPRHTRAAGGQGPEIARRPGDQEADRRHPRPQAGRVDRVPTGEFF